MLKKQLTDDLVTATKNKDKESISFAKQIKRYAKVGGVVGTLATKLAGQKYLGVKLDKKKHATEVKNALNNNIFL